MADCSLQKTRYFLLMRYTTTENPSFEVIPALLSRCQVYVLNPFTKEDLEALLHRAMETDEILKHKNITLKETEALLRLSGGDGRKLLNIFELIVNASEGDDITITNEKVMQLVQKTRFCMTRPANSIMILYRPL